jgi:hypothetical protein
MKKPKPQAKPITVEIPPNAAFYDPQNLLAFVQGEILRQLGR